jgi:hypothetical protein
MIHSFSFSLQNRFKKVCIIEIENYGDGWRWPLLNPKFGPVQQLISQEIEGLNQDVLPKTPIDQHILR